MTQIDRINHPPRLHILWCQTGICGGIKGRHKFTLLQKKNILYPWKSQLLANPISLDYSIPNSHREFINNGQKIKHGNPACIYAL